MRKPKGFVPATNLIKAEKQSRPSFIRPKKVRGAKRQGILYEQAVHNHFVEKLDGYSNGPWFTFHTDCDPSKRRWCQPDALWVSPELNRITIIECKLRHCLKSWWQLYHLYLPVVEYVYGSGYDYRLVEIVKWYDPDEAYPEHQLISSVSMAPPSKVGVHIWNPR